MGRAFTEEERMAVQEKLRRCGLRLFSEKGIRGVSVREVTGAAGIAQGGFYTFYADKDAFITDLLVFRIGEKLQMYLERKEESLADPTGYLTRMLIREGLHLRDNRAFDQHFSDVMALFEEKGTDTRHQVGEMYRQYLEKMQRYWAAAGWQVEIDFQGFENLLRAGAVLLAHAALMDDLYWRETFEDLCTSGIRRYVQVTGAESRGRETAE
ncbi:MAG: TetR/AcrR family transcriptional regulator [Clostridia bacterium]|nr:TetR/AcrR family transcriptional regulator [Clostridia bacterium]